MNLLDVYNLFDKGDITQEEAASTLGMTLKTFRFRCTKWGHRLPLLLAILDKIKEDKITREEAAVALSVTAREVNQLMKSWNISRPVKEYALNKAKAEVKWEIRKRYAIDFIAGSSDIDDAAERAEVSVRQMRRWVSDLINKHFGMVWGDLKLLSNAKRKSLALEVEKAENLELERQQTLNAIASGRKTLESEALDRALTRKKKRG